MRPLRRCSPEWFARYRENIKTTAGMYVFHSTSTQALFEKHITDAGFGEMPARLE